MGRKMLKLVYNLKQEYTSNFGELDFNSYDGETVIHHMN